ncbi:MAG: hypothetical protein IPK06_04375 [Ignavibacteriae bacterium]|nr:hypothetical protein [Ignavibacteriota bacterium]
MEQAFNIYNSERGGELRVKSSDQLERESKKEIDYVKRVMKEREAKLNNEATNE